MSGNGQGIRGKFLDQIILPEQPTQRVMTLGVVLVRNRRHQFGGQVRHQPLKSSRKLAQVMQRQKEHAKRFNLRQWPLQLIRQRPQRELRQFQQRLPASSNIQGMERQ